QQVVQSGTGNGYGGIWKSITQGTNKIVHVPDVALSKLIEAAEKPRRRPRK
ncbi:hypothetical protein PHYSODRAFT_458696, partial [Phytophthora sojae]